MRGFIRSTVAGALMVLPVTALRAQSDSEFAAWTAMMVTPFGALPPLVTPALAGLTNVEVEAGNSAEARWGRWSFGGGEEAWNNFGIGGRGQHIGIALGYGRCEGCEDGIVMAGLDYEWVLTPLRTEGMPAPSSLVVSLRPSGGFALATGEGTESAISIALDAPVSFPVPVGELSRIAPFIAPGLGYGRFSADDTDSTESGIRISMGAGIAFVSPGGLGFHLGWRKIFIEDGPSTFGLGVSYGG